MEQLLADFAGNPVVQTILLFVGPFILEEAALVAGAALAAAGELPALVALAALFAGMVISDWALYAAGHLAGRFGRVRRFIGDRNLELGRKMLHENPLSAAVTARLVPWMLLPIFMASGFLHVGFARFAIANAIIALVYTNILFWALFALDLLVFELLDGWGWFVVAIVALAVILMSRHVANRIQRRKLPQLDEDK